MPAWYRNARWVRGEIASEDDGSLHIAALSELYADGRHSMADGIDTHSFPRSFAFSVVAATERAHTRAGDSAAAWNSMPESARTIKLLEYLSCSGWPVQLDHWRTSSAALQADLHGMFMYTDCRGAGSAAERELLSSPFRARGVLQQLQPLWGVITLAPSFPLLQAALRALLSSASSPGRDVFITLDAAIAVNKMLAGALTHCTGASFAAKSFDDRVSIAKELVEKSFQLDRISAFGGLAAGGSSAGDVVSGGGSGTSKVAGKFDRVRLEQLKNDNDYNSTKRQLLKAHAGGEVDKAILIGLRGADSLVARPPGAPVVRLPPQKVLHDLLLGSNDKELEVYSVDKELEAAIPGLRRALPAFWGRRAAKALSIDHGKSIPLEALALFMASTGTWGTKPPDFYNEVLVPMRIADGDTADSVHASFNYVPGSDVYANATVVNAIADLVGNLLLDVGVHGEATVNDFADAGASDIVSTHDVFGMVAYVHARLGALPTTAGKISDLLRGLLGDWGTARSVVRSSSDPHRPLNVRFVELSSTRLFDFFKHKLEQTAGRDAAASMRAAGFHVEVSPQAPPAAHPAAPSASPTPAHAVGVVTLKRDSPEFLSEVQKEVRKQLKQHSGKGLVPDPEQGEPMTLVVTSNGARAHVTGDFRGAKGCLYSLSGPNGVSSESPLMPLLSATERMAVAQHDVQEYLLSKAADLRQLGDVQQALFFEGCAARVEPAPLGEVPASLVGEKLADADMQELAIRPFRRTTIISKTAAPSYKPRPTAFPPDLPTPTCHASFLLSEVMETCHKWHADADAWHQRRMAGVEAKRPKGVAWGLDAIKPEWRGFFADGGVAVFDEKTGTPSCLTLENYSLSHHLNGGFALREFADYPDREAVASIGDGISIKAQGLPALQLACNLEALYEAGGAEGVRCVADELRKFGKFDDTGWYLRAPSPSRKQGCLGTATLPSCATPIGAVPKKDGGTRIIIDLGFPYGKLKLNKIKEAPLPPDELWDGVSAYRPAGARPNESSITLGGGGAVAMPPNVASGPSRPPHGETYEAGGQWPWPYEAKSTVVEQAENDLILSVPCQAANLAVYHLGWDFWKCFHQSNYRAFELIATACVVPELNEEGEVADEQRGISNGRMAMGLSPASGFCQRNGNMGDWGVMRRFDARQEARRLTEPELPAVASWLDARRSLPPDAYGTQGRLACGGFYSDDPKYTVCGPVSRVGDLVHSFYEVMGPEGLGFRMAEPHKWLVACWAAWQGIRMSAMLGILWLPPAKSLRANEDLREFEQGRMVGAEFIKMMGFLNYLAEILAVPKYVNHTMWRAYDDHKELCDGTDVGVAVMRPQPAQSKAIATWRKTIMTTPGTTLLRIVRRVPPPRDGVIVWTPSSDACMDTVVVDGVVVAGHLHGAVDVNGKKMHDPPGMGGALYGRLWQYPFTAAEIEVVTIPVAEFMAGPVGLIVLDGDGALEYAERICLEIDAEATPRTALQGEARSAGLLVAHDEFTKLPVYAKYKARLSGKHVFGAGNVSDPASRSRNSEAERLVRFLGLEPRWLPVPPEALDYVAAVVARLLSLKQAKKTPGSCDPAEPGGDAPRFGSPRLVSRRASFISAVPPSSSPSLAGSPRLIRGSSAPAMPLSPPLAKRTKMRDLRASPYAVPPGMESPPALSAGIGSSPRLTRAVARLHSPPPVALDPFGRPPPGLASALFSAVAVTCATAADPRALERGVAAVSDSRTSFVVEQRVDQLLAVNSNSTSSYAFRGDPEELRDLVGASVRAQAFAANDNSLAAEQGHYHLYWMPYCDQQFTPYIRPDLRRLSFDEAQLEEAWWGGAIPWIQKRMPNGQGIIGAALPQSILKVVRNIRRAHKRQGIETASLGAAVRATDGLLKEFLLEHGALALVPKRKEPLTNEEIAAMFRYSGPIGATRSKKTLDWLSSQYSSLLAMFHTLAQTGMRKGEVSLPPKVRFDKSRLSMRNIRWRIGGVVYDELTPELYARLCSEGGYALLRPPPSKADPFSLHWGPCTIYLRYDATENINAARELAREEMRRCVPLSERESTPLFVTSDGAAWRHQELATVFHQIVTAVCGDARAKQVSMHSWRVYLACALLSKGASFATIQAMLRWKSEDALRIYARMNDFVYADWLSSAQGALISSVRTTTSATDALSAAPDPGTLAGALLDASHAEANAMRDAAHSSAAGCAEAGFHDEWRRRAACAIDAAVRDAHTAEEQPVYDAYGSLAGLHSSMSTLMLEADRADAEDVALLRE